PVPLEGPDRGAARPGGLLRPHVPPDRSPEETPARAAPALPSRAAPRGGALLAAGAALRGGPEGQGVVRGAAARPDGHDLGLLGGRIPPVRGRHPDPRGR